MDKCIIISRVSTYIQSTKHSLDSQENYLREYAHRHNYKIKNSIREVGSVWRKKSKINIKILNLLRNTLNTKFLLLDVSRLCRCPKLGTTILNLLKRNDICVAGHEHTADEKIVQKTFAICQP